jgi:carbon storage regulator
MLVISRRKGQRVTIGDEIELVITELHRSHVKVGITAPRGYAVLRGEVFDSIEAANRAAAASELDLTFTLPEPPPDEQSVNAQDQSLAPRQSAGAEGATAGRRSQKADKSEPPRVDEVSPA